VAEDVDRPGCCAVEDARSVVLDGLTLDGLLVLLDRRTFLSLLFAGDIG
jgi:hypothetical protein